MGNKTASLLCTRRRRKKNANHHTIVADSSDEEVEEEEEEEVEEEEEEEVEEEQLPPKITWKHFWPVDQTQHALVKSPFSRIPVEISIEIFQLLSVDDLNNVSLVCRSFKMIADRDEIWKLKCNTSNKLWSKSFKEIYMDWIYERYLCKKQFKIAEIKLWKSKRGVGRKFHEVNNLYRCCHEFNEHSNSSPEMTIQLSVNIERTARQLISLLEKASRFETQWYQPAIMKQMIMRYYRFMQLKASLPDNIFLVPTLDIEIIWQTHLMRPTLYRNDCLRLFHRIIDHSLLTDDIGQCIKEQAFIDTCQLYEEKFGERYCSLPVNKKTGVAALKYHRSSFELLPNIMQMYFYWDETYFEFASESPSDYDNPFSFTEADVILDEKWLDLCKKFMFEVASNEGYDPSDMLALSFLSIEQMKKSYKRFLYIVAKYSPANEFQCMLPTYAIDIIWRSHLQEPLKYASDCWRLTHCVIDHVVLSSIEIDQMKELCEKTNDIWKQEFPSDMKRDHFYNCNDDLDNL